MHADLVQWSDDFSVGIPEVDQQHRGLIDLVNRAYAAVISHASSAEVAEVVHALEHYTVQHFADEEQYMIHARYPKFGAHKSVHDQFVERVAAEKERLLAGFPLDIDIVHFLRDWLVNHILRMDKEFGLYERSLHEDVRAKRSGFFNRLFGGRPALPGQPVAVRGFGAWVKSVFAGPAEVPVDSSDALTQEEASGEGLAPVVGLDFKGAIEVHMRWKARFNAVISGASDEKLDIETVRADDRCALGMWLYGEAKQRFGSRAEYLYLLMWHAEFHQRAAGILDAVNSERRAEAIEDLERGPYMLAAIKLRGCLAKLFVSTGAR